jgi:hypothetical protein
VRTVLRGAAKMNSTWHVVGAVTSNPMIRLLISFQMD